MMGYFDVLGVEHARALTRVAYGGRPVIALVLADTAADPAVLAQPARAQMAAALRMVDFVLIAGSPGSPDNVPDLVNRLKPAEIVPLEEAEARRKRRLIEQIQHGHPPKHGTGR